MQAIKKKTLSNIPQKLPTLKIIKQYLANLKTYKVPTGTQVFDWNIPKEWRLRKAWIKKSNGEIDKINCGLVTKIRDLTENKINYDCDDRSYYPKRQENISNSYSSLINAGNYLKKFRKEYYTGFFISMIGTIVAITGEEKAGLGIGLIGGIVQARGMGFNLGGGGILMQNMQYM